MKTDRERVEAEMYQAVGSLVHDNGRHLGEEDWRRIFDEVLANAFADIGEDDEPED